MGRKRKNGAPWSDLPMGPLEQISKSLDTETDVLRFRAVCKSWRSSATSFKKFPFANLKLPYPFSDYESSFETQGGAYYRLTERTVYRVQSPKPNNPNSWLLKLETADDGKLRLVNPLNELQIKIPPESPFPKVLNTLNFRVSEVCRAYTLHYVNPSNPYYYDECPYSKKVAVYADSDSKSNDYIVMAIGDRNKLWYIKSGDEKWTMMDKEFGWANSFHDVMFYKGEFHVVDACGAAWVLNSNFERTNATRSLRDASKRRLVEMYDGELYLVEGVTDKDKRACKCDIDDGCGCRFPNTPFLKTVVEVIVSKMDRSKCKWVETKAVKDRVIFMGEDCSFALPSKEFKGCNGGRVFYTDWYLSFRIEEEKMVDDYGYDDYHECDGPGCCSSDEEDKIVRRDDFVPSGDVKSMFRGWHGHNVGVYDMKSRKIGSLLKFPAFAGVFWPPPRWL